VRLVPRRCALTSERLPALLSLALAVGGFVTVLVLHETGGGTIDVPWAPTLDLRLTFTLDGLGALYSLLATGVGAAVFAYSSRYLPLHHLHVPRARPVMDSWRFHGLLALFMVSMVGLATAQDLILLFVFWDLTAVASYFLVGYDRHERESRVAALMAILVTGISAVCLLIGALMLHAEYGSFSLPVLFEAAGDGSTTVTVACALIAIAGLAKSAQVPMHFWLPRAMAAPTPVSAYLHSAAMVAAGVFLLARTYPLIQTSGLLLDLLLAIGLTTIAVGGVISLTRDNLKQVLAYSTISQYGYVVTLLGLGGPKGALAASFYVIAHAIAKAALFLTAGAVTEATGSKTLSGTGGLARAMPVLAVASGIAAAALAALPLTIGFFKDELFFGAAVERGTLAAVAAVLAAGITFGYVGRFWTRIFLGPSRAEPEAIPALLVWPIVLLAGVAVVGGVIVGPFERLAESAGLATLGEPTPGKAAYHLDLRAENVMALGAYAIGALILVSEARWRAIALGFARLGERVGPARMYEVGLARLDALSDAVHFIEVRDLRTRVASVLLPAGLLVLAGIIATPSEGLFEVGTIGEDDIALALMLIVSAGAAIAATIPRDHLMLVLVVGAVGFSLAVVYALFGGPDVALVAVLVETVFALLFLAIFALLPRAVLRREANLPSNRLRARRNALTGVLSGLFAFVVAWAALSRPTPEESVSVELYERTEDAHAKDSVTAILADFRGLDTIIEITVVGVAFLGIATLLRKGRMT
jgi:multicomponent Na+:H+ antiporter subunit A